MGVELTYTLNGRKVSRQQFFDGFEGAIRQEMVDQLTAQVEQVSCPEHGKGITVSEVIQTNQGFSFTLTGCCDQGVALAENSLS
jgi:hypothetical protein